MNPGRRAAGGGSTRRLPPGSSHSTCQSPSTRRLARPHCRQGGMSATANPSGWNWLRPEASIGRSHSISTTARPSAPRSIRTTATSAFWVPSGSASSDGVRTLRTVAPGGSVIRSVETSGGRPSSRTVASVTATLPSMRTRLSTIACGTKPVFCPPVRRSPSRTCAGPESPTTVTRLPAPAPASTRSTLGWTDRGWTVTRGSTRGVRSSSSEAVAAGRWIAKDSWVGDESTAIRPSSRIVWRLSAAAGVPASSSQARYPLSSGASAAAPGRLGSAVSSSRPCPSCRTGAVSSTSPSSSDTLPHPGRTCRTTISTVTGQPPSPAAPPARSALTAIRSTTAAGTSGRPGSPSFSRNRSTKSR